MEERGIFASASSRGLLDEDPVEISGSAIVVSVVENRAREVCICKIDGANPYVLEIFLIADSHSYNETIDTIQAISPNEILLHDGCRHKVLSRTVEQLCKTDDSRILYISRQYFDQDRGAEMLKTVLVEDVDADLVAKYIVLSGAYCLLRYKENCSGVTLAGHTMRVEYGNTRTSAKMHIDRRTAINLELISNAKDGNQKNSLFGAINHTKTVVGARLLKSTILRPNADAATINSRLDLVEAFLTNNRVFVQVVELLRQFPDLDKMLSGLTTVPKNITPKTAKFAIDTMIYLKQTLKLSPILADVLKDLQQKTKNANPFQSNNSDYLNPKTLLEALIANLEAPPLNVLLGLINSSLTESTEYSRNSHSMRHQECFALKTGIHGMLDLARQTFLQTVEDIHSLAEQYSLEHSVTMKVMYTSGRGYYLSIPASFNPLPVKFTQSVANKRTVSCSTEQMTSLSDRAIEAITQALTLTHELCQELLTKVRQNMQCLFSITDCISLLDMLSSFVDLVALNPHPFTRPIVSDHTTQSPLIIKGGRHPVVSSQSIQQLTTSFVANDLHMTPGNVNMHIISGPNGSGKTVYIKQVALIMIMAQMGCFVPARQATIPLRDRLLSRIGCGDDIEHNMSTFATEMKEAAYILNNVTPASLVIIDELGRGTSNIDGVSIAFSIAESLLHSDALTLFVTHYPLVTTLPNMYPNVKNYHLKTVLNVGRNVTANANEDGGSMVYLHTLASGTSDLKSGYGIVMAEQCGFPTEIIEDAKIIQNTIKEIHPTLGSQEYQCHQDHCAITLHSLLQQLQVLHDSTQDDLAKRIYLSNLRSKMSDELVEQLLTYLGDDQPNIIDSNDQTDNPPITEVVDAVADEVSDDVTEVVNVVEEALTNKDIYTAIVEVEEAPIEYATDNDKEVDPIDEAKSVHSDDTYAQEDSNNKLEVIVGDEFVTKG